MLDIYRKLRPGEPPTIDAARTLLDNFYFNPKRYDLAKVGRYKINKKLGLTEAFDQQTLTVDDSTVSAGYANFCRVSSTPEELTATVKAEVARWTDVIRRADIKPSE